MIKRETAGFGVWFHIDKLNSRMSIQKLKKAEPDTDNNFPKPSITLTISLVSSLFSLKSTTRWPQCSVISYFLNLPGSVLISTTASYVILNFRKKNSNFEKNFEEKKITKFFAFLGFGLDFEVRIFCSIFYRV